MSDLDALDGNLTNPSQTDRELIQALKEQKTDALSGLYDRYGNLVYTLALKILNNSQDAEDVTQEVFLTLWRNNTYNPTRGSLSSYLTILTRSRSLDKLRSRGTRLKFIKRWSQYFHYQAPQSPIELVVLKDRSEQVQQALARLPENQRQILEMAYYEGLSQSEIGKKLDIPLGTVKTWGRQGLLKLRKMLQDLIK